MPHATPDDSWPTPTEEGHVSAAGYRLYYRSAGIDRDGRSTLLCLHGGPGATHEYLRPIADLAERGYRTVFIDQLGCGRSDRPADRSVFTVEHNVREVEDVRLALGLGRVHLFGSSYGGLLALAFAVRHPDSLRSLITAGGVASVPLAVREMNRLIDELPEPIRQSIRRCQAEGRTSGEEYERGVAAFYQRHVCRLDPVPPRFAKTLREINPDVYGLMNGPDEFTVVGTIAGWDESDRLGEIRVPALVTGGAYDEVTPVVARQIADGIPGAELEIFPNSSHLPFWEERDAYLERLERFLEKVRSSDRSGA